MQTIEKVIGVDFSGAKEAGRSLWLAEGICSPNGLHITQCRRGEALPGSGRTREECHAALVRFLALQKACLVGMDFPFTLPLPFMREQDYVTFVTWFFGVYPTPEMLRDTVRDRKRRTDIETRTPFAPTNLRLYRQTYYGIRDVLAPLVSKGIAVALPMQSAISGIPWLVEICPASSLKAARYYLPYKGTTNAHHNARLALLSWLETKQRVHLPPDIRQAAADNTGGDALDSLLAAAIAARLLFEGSLLTAPAGDIHYRREGYVYV